MLLKKKLKFKTHWLRSNGGKAFQTGDEKCPVEIKIVCEDDSFPWGYVFYFLSLSTYTLSLRPPQLPLADL